ncbi:DUF3581 domain-containing protein [Vibrio agarivorans]|uniref:DUF3581 domain-containing protein n=1 Tax=Vibrio agarivorans TaxID=153622 RepID=UPI0025B41774|nr:DUF3581 domain-containing protein [Vibrio agarivorans]MDN3663582.1 DUF3581 domain-containing protein [Vibrio agarivorans]
MFLDSYFTQQDQHIVFSRQQASHFAKLVAGDFNPIHDEDSKRFCVPGDLLFSVLLQKEGISQNMRIEFAGMVNDGVALSISDQNDTQASVVDDQGKAYLNMTRSGEISRNQELIEHVVKAYVKFSGMNFPHIMVPLMEEQQMMINCQRPLVIYESMEVEFARLDITHPEVEFTGATFEVEGKRGVVTMNFEFKEDGQVIGNGKKRMIASGLKPYSQEAVTDLVAQFNERKASFLRQVEQAA